MSTVPQPSNASGAHRVQSARVRGQRRGLGSSGAAESIPRSVISVPVSIRPSINASLWMPATRCMISSGLAAPSHRAVTSATPHRRANRGVAQTIIPTPMRTTRRWDSTAATMFSPVIAEMPRPIHRKSGP